MDDETKNSELIARLLMQDQLQDAAYYENPYLKNYMGEEEDQDDDYVPIHVLKNAKKRVASQRGQPNLHKETVEPKLETSGDAATDDSSALDSIKLSELEEDEDDSSKKIRKKRTSKKKDGEKVVKKRWSPEEEKLFEEALELHGREWDKVQAHIKTRDKPSIRSHAQKHFVKLYKEGKELPAKVKESGAGHTLSGKPLDPHSASARLYLGLKRKDENAKSDNEDSQDIAASIVASTERDDATNGNSSELGSPKKKKKKPFREQDLKLDVQDFELNDAIRSKTVKTRNREQTPSLSWQLGSMPTDPLTMVKCGHFSGEAGATNTAQPFKVEITWNALLIADFHSHLATTEVIGFLAGSWDAEKKVLTITDAFPCNSLEIEAETVNVEMDPNSELQVRELIKQKGLRVVGWYHSHPVFQPDPSIRDIENQTNYQALFRDEVVKIEPFVGIIVGPYDIRMLTEESSINWFYVKNVSKGHIGQPMYIDHKILNSDEISPELSLTLHKLIDNYKLFPSRVNLEELWRYCAPLAMDELKAASNPDTKPKINVEPVTKLVKLQRAMKARLPKTPEGEALLKEVVDTIELKWNKI